MPEHAPKDMYLIAEDDNDLYIRADCSGAHPLSLVFDGVPLVVHAGNAYVRVEDVVEWHRKELLGSRGRSGDDTVKSVLAEILAEFRAGRRPGGAGDAFDFV